MPGPEETLAEVRNCMRRSAERKNTFERLWEAVNEICDRYGLPHEEMDAHAERDR